MTGTEKTLIGLGAIGIVAALTKITTMKKMLYPVANPKITSGFGTRIHPVTKERTFHNGIDLAAPVGTVVAAPGAGTVTSIYSSADGGNQLIIKHDNGFTTGYAHLSRTIVVVGQQVATSQVIAYTGNTGRTTGPHLHFTMKDEKGNLVNPVLYLV